MILYLTGLNSLLSVSNPVICEETIAMAAANDSEPPHCNEMTIMQQPNTSTPKSHLLALPAELRNAIYELVVAEDGPIRESRYVEHGLFQTCHQIRDESSKMFYRLNTFRFDCHVFTPVLLEMTRNCIQEMRTIHIHTGRTATSWWDNHWHECPVVLGLDVSKGLRDIRYELWLDNHGGVGPFELFEIGCRPDCGHMDSECVRFRRLRTVKQYLDQCAEKARPGTYMTPQIFEKVAKILVGKW